MLPDLELQMWNLLPGSITSLIDGLMEDLAGITPATPASNSSNKPETFIFLNKSLSLY